jgi:hypothetical protein
MMNIHPILPIGLLNLPRCHGPRRNRLPTKNTRMKMGIVNATIAAMAPTEKIAPMETEPPKMRSRSRMPIAVLNQTALTGVKVVLLTLLIQEEHGKQSSLAYAKVTRDAASIQPPPMENPHIMVRARIARAIF